MADFTFEEATAAPSTPPSSSSKEFSYEEAMGGTQGEVTPPQLTVTAKREPKSILGSVGDYLSNNLQDLNKNAPNIIGRTGRMALEGGSSLLSFPMKFLMEGLGGAAGLTGNADYAKHIKDTYGLSSPDAGTQVADAMGLEKPQGKLQTALDAGGKAMVAGSFGPGAAASKGGMLLNAISGTGMEAAPQETLGTMGAVGAVLAAAKAKQGVSTYLDSRRYNQLFKSNPQATTDAKVIQDLGRDSRDVLNINPVSGKPALLRASEANAEGGDYLKAVKSKLTEADLKDPKLNLLLQQNNPTKFEIDAVRGTPQGDAVADAITLDRRAYTLTAPKQSSRMGAVGRAAVDIAPMPIALNYGIKKFFGSRGTREEGIAELTNSRTQRAADKFAASQPTVSPIEQSMGVLDEVTAANKLQAAAEAAPKIGDTPLAQTLSKNQENSQSEIDKAFTKQNSVSDFDMMSGMKKPDPTFDSTPMSTMLANGNKGSLSEIDKAFTKQNSVSDFNIMSLLKEEAPKATSNASVKATKAASKAADLADTQHLQGLKKTEGIDSGGGSISATTEALGKSHGLDQKGTKQLIKDVMASRPDDAVIQKIGQRILDNKTTSSMLDFQDILKQHATDKGLGSGALSPAPLGSGALSGPMSPQYTAGMIQRSNAYDKGIEAVKGLGLPKNTTADAVSSIADIRTMSGSANRKAAAQALYDKYPESKDALTQVFKDFK